MAGGIDEALHDAINRKIHGHVLVDFSACSIFKGPNPLRKINEELEEMEEEARKFYSEPLDHIGRKELVAMMLLDGCFIIELIFHSTMNELLTNFYLRKVMRDLLLVENQLPFSVLAKLYSLSSCLPLDTAKEHIADKAIRFFCRMKPGSPINALIWNPDVKHLPGLLHYLCSYSSVEVTSEMVVQQWRFIPSATELDVFRIKFRPNKGKLRRNEGKLFDIKFQNKVMSIPTLKIDDDTESILQNLVAYEQCQKGISSKCFTDYITFMNCLINTGEDVELLCRCGVIDNWLGDNEVVATMFNRLRDSVLISEEDFFFSEIFNRVNEHCYRPFNLWKARTWRRYLNTPDTFLSFMGGVFMLVSGLLQTLFTILSYHS